MKKGHRVTKMTWPILAAFCLLVPIHSASAAEPAKAFYQDRSIRFVVGFAPGGGFDIYARAIARHIPRHIPGHPSVIVQNMPGAGSLVAANYLYNVAKPDGLTVGTLSRALPFGQLVGMKGIEFDVRRFNWLGSPNQEVSLCAIRGDTGIKSLEQAAASPESVIFGATGPASDAAQYPLALNEMLGTSFKVITGYAGIAPVLAALERGEVNAFCAPWGTVKVTRPDWVKDKYVNVLVQLGLEEHPDLKGVPLVLRHAKTERDRRFLEIVLSRQVMAYPYAAPPGVPAKHLAVLRQAFNKTMQDPDFRRESEKMGLEINPASGETIQKLVEEIFAADPEVRKRLDIFK